MCTHPKLLLLTHDIFRGLRNPNVNGRFRALAESEE